jgi:UV DNA damage endonuclease
MDVIGCPADHNSPMNLHVHNNQGTREEIANRFLSNYNKLDPNCRARLTIENDDKLNCWSAKELVEIFHPITNIPICFDYLHNKCHPSYDTEEEAVRACYNTWNGMRPLFHYSESRPGNNPRAHADYACEPFDTYGLDFDVDMELKAKDLAILKYQGETCYA